MVFVEDILYLLKKKYMFVLNDVNWDVFVE